MASVEEELIRALRDRQDRLADSVIAGVATDYAQYLRLCGEYAGVTYALNTLNDIMRGKEDGEV